MHTDIDAAPGLPGGGVHSCVPRTAFVLPIGGYLITMTDSPDARTDHRAADLLPEERAAGSADPRAQAEAILEDSDQREADLEAAPDSFPEHRTSAQTIAPGEGIR